MATSPPFIFFLLLLFPSIFFSIRFLLLLLLLHLILLHLLFNFVSSLNIFRLDNQFFLSSPCKFYRFFPPPPHPPSPHAYFLALGQSTRQSTTKSATIQVFLLPSEKKNEKKKNLIN